MAKSSKKSTKATKRAQPARPAAAKKSQRKTKVEAREPLVAAQIATESIGTPLLDPPFEPFGEPIDMMTQPGATLAPLVALPVEPPREELAPPPSLLGHRGQIQAEKARFDLGPQRRVLSEALGELPAGYGVTFVSAWVRDPRHIVASWDVNAPHELALAEQIGWDRMQLHVHDADGNTVRQISVARRSGIWHVRIPGTTTRLRVSLGLQRPDRSFVVLARSHLLELPVAAPRVGGEVETIRLPTRLDRRTLLRAEPPPRAGYANTGHETAAWRLHQRLQMAQRLAPREQVVGPFQDNPNPGQAPQARHVSESEPPTATEPPTESEFDRPSAGLNGSEVREVTTLPSASRSAVDVEWHEQRDQAPRTASSSVAAAPMRGWRPVWVERTPPSDWVFDRPDGPLISESNALADRDPSTSPRGGFSRLHRSEG